MSVARTDLTMSDLKILEAQILMRLEKSPATGIELRRELAAAVPAFNRAAANLWKQAALRGLKQDGCCNDPCGIHCVSALDGKRQWLLTDRGAGILRKLRAATIVG